MTRIRSIAAGELPAFISTAASAEHAADQHSYLTRLLDQGATRLEWCWLAEPEDGGPATGRIVLWTLPKVGRPLSFVLFDATDDEAASALLACAIVVAREAGGTTFGSVIDDPPQTPQWQTDPERRTGWLTSAGFSMRRATSRWELDPAATAEPSPSTRLRFEADPDETTLLDAIERVGEGALDRYTRQERERLGPAGEARQTLEENRDLESGPGWWELAYDEADELVGLVMPSRAPSMGTIGYIGVVPEQRGRGYVNDLLARGTATLLRIDAPILRADADLDNEPMAAAFERGGWTQIGTRRELEMRLAHIDAEARSPTD
jgi:RimJ/RimL family protein N-acetyltransferase